MIARGGMAEIFLAHRDDTSDRLVVKRIREDRRVDPTTSELFRSEARIARHFHHPNLVQVRELIEEDGQLAMAMEFVDGYSIRELLQRCRQYGRLVPIEIAAYIIAEAAEGLHYAHELRDEGGAHLHVVHRDISPGNVIVTPEGGVRLLDFGVATSDLMPGDEDDGVRGKLAYLAPEAILNRPFDRRVDVFGLGVVFYELLTLHPCFAHDDPLDTLDAIIQGRFRPAQEWRETIPAELVMILERMLARRPENRFGTAADVSILLWQYLVQTEPVMADDIRNFFAELFFDLPDIERSPHERDTVEIDSGWLLDFASSAVEGDTFIDISDIDWIPLGEPLTALEDVLAALDLPTTAPWSSKPLDEDNWSVSHEITLTAPATSPLTDDDSWQLHAGALPPSPRFAD
jgi:serine/threonine protein kinase